MDYATIASNLGIAELNVPTLHDQQSRLESLIQNISSQLQKVELQW